MAEEIILVDDIDGSQEHVSRLEFTWRGIAYEIDLTQERQDKANETMAELITHARKTKRPSAPSTSSKAAAAKERKAIRQWAKRQNIEIPARGPIPNDIVTQYKATR